MDIARLAVSIPSTKIADDGSTYTYGVAVTYGKLHWEAYHRFSDFITLYERVANCGIEAVPSPPPKSLMGRPLGSQAVEERRIMLETWLKGLCTRPDIRTSPPFVEFLEFDLHTSTTVDSLSPECIASCRDGRFHLTHFQLVTTQQGHSSVFACYEEGAAISRLGRVWSLVEADEAGAISIWSLESTEHGRRHTDTSYASTTNALYYSTTPPSHTPPPPAPPPSLLPAFAANLLSSVTASKALPPEAPYSTRSPSGGAAAAFFKSSHHDPYSHLSNTPSSDHTGIADDPAAGGGGFGLGVDFDRLLHTNVRQRCRSLFFHRRTGRLFVAYDNGVVDVHRVPPSLLLHDRGFAAQQQGDSFVTHGSAILGGDDEQEERLFCGLQKEEQLHLHTEAVMSLYGDDSGPGRILTVGFDKGVRLLNCSTLETICGGKLSKRLASGHFLTTGIVESASSEEAFQCSRIFVGASNAKVYVLSSICNPPDWIQTIDCGGETSAVTALAMAGSNLLVARKYLLVIFKVGRAGSQEAAEKLIEYRADLDAGRTIHSICVSRTTPLLFLGHTRSISVWNVIENACVCVFKAHHGGIPQLQILEGDDNPLSPHTADDRGRPLQLLSGGFDGYIKLWNFQSPSELRSWADPTKKVDQQGHGNKRKAKPKPPPVGAGATSPRRSPAPHAVANRIANLSSGAS